MLLKLCYQFTSLRQLHCISSRLFTRLSGRILSSLCPLQWSHPLHSLWQQQLHGNYLNTIYSQPGSPTLEKEPNTCWVHSTELVIYSVLYLKEMLGTCCFLKEKTCKTIRNNVDKLKYCTDIMRTGSETGSQSCKEEGKLQYVNMHLLAWGYHVGRPKQLAAPECGTQRCFLQWGWVLLCLIQEYIFGLELAAYLGGS